MDAKEIAERLVGAPNGWPYGTADEMRFLAADYLRTQEPLGDERFRKMDECRFLLPEPGAEVVGECLAEIRRLQAEVKTAQDDLEGYFREIEDHAFIMARVKNVTRYVEEGKKIRSREEFDSLMDDVRALATVKIDDSAALTSMADLRAQLQTATTALEAAQTENAHLFESLHVRRNDYTGRGTWHHSRNSST